MRRRFLLPAALLLTACTAPAVPAPGPASAPPAAVAPALGTNGAAVPALEWRPCHGKYQCAAAEVPLSYRDPGGSKIGLSVIRLPATDPGQRIGSLFLNFGGPGTGGVGDLLRFGERYPEELRAKFDLVSFDPRGIGGSTPISCPGTENPPAGGSPMRPAQRDAFYAASAATGKSCADASGPLLAHLSSANVARDLELLRQGVGDPELNYLGYSYGSYLGATYANLFGDRVRALTLDGTLDLVANATGAPGTQNAPVDVRADVASAQRDELDAFFAACVQAGPECAFSGGDPKAKFADIAARLSQGPIGGTTLPSLLKTVDSALYQSGRWSALAETLNSLYPSAQGAAAANPPLLDPYTPTHSAAFLAVQCVDSDNPRDPADYDRLAASEQARVPYFGPSAVFGMAQCIGWPSRDEDRYTGPWNQPRRQPVLIINSRHDPATPWHNARAAAEQLGDARLLTVEGYGHTSLNVHSGCAMAAMVRYFTTLAVPEPGATCAPDTRPFP
ncbi:alpha/beta hydrolase [Amycolatopsis nigrescens]|uniref:alpha/beta hydrolase n=1 Tax=Amycolatopsis nigrescens TaxID=381445 RepID=UPI00036F4B74|nr:alpha/beta hydrolase [Amycolatopsis nigrescens]